MGCGSCKPSSNQDTILIRIIDYIERDDITNLEALIKQGSLEEGLSIDIWINKPLVKLNNFTVSLLGYSLWIGKANAFNFLITSLNADLGEMDDLFKSFDISVLALLCERGYFEVLKLYLPFYIQNNHSSNSGAEKSLSLSFTKSNCKNELISTSITPIQLACKYSHLSIVHYINDYFSLSYPPQSLNIHFIEETTGENCALISARTGNFPMMKYLFEVAHADFHIKNNSNEGALQVLAISSKSNYGLQFLECVMYLIEIIKIDISYKHKETLLILDNKIIIKYLEDKLKQLGINTSKQSLLSSSKPVKPTQPDPAQDKSSLLSDLKDLSSITTESCPSNFCKSLRLI